MLVLTGYGSDEAKELDKLDFKPNHIAKDLYDAALWILGQNHEKNEVGAGEGP